MSFVPCPQVQPHLLQCGHAEEVERASGKRELLVPPVPNDSSTPLHSFQVVVRWVPCHIQIRYQQLQFWGTEEQGTGGWSRTTPQISNRMISNPKKAHRPQTAPALPGARPFPEGGHRQTWLQG